MVVRPKESKGGKGMAESHIISKVVVSGNVVEVYTYSKGIRCGVPREYDIVRDRSNDISKEEGKRIDSIFRARQTVRRIIWANETPYSKFVTLTYAKTELDVRKVMDDIKVFVKHMRRHNYEMKYLYVLENQKARGLKEGNDGCLHVHMVIFNDKKIPLDLLNSAWPHGSTDIGILREKENSGAYISKYITKDTASFFMENVYHCSRGLKRGVVENFYLEGCSDSTFNGFSPADVMRSLNVRYSKTMHHSYLSTDGAGQEQIVTYYQGTFKGGNVIAENAEVEYI